MSCRLLSSTTRGSVASATTKLHARSAGQNVSSISLDTNTLYFRSSANLTFTCFRTRVTETKKKGKSAEKASEEILHAGPHSNRIYECFLIGSRSK